MPTPTWADEPSRLIAAAAPDVPVATAEELDRTWLTVRNGLRNVRPARRRRVRALVGAGIAALALTGGGVAAAGVFSAHTGRYPVDAEDLRLGGPGEYLDPSAPDFGAVVDELTADIPFPNDRSRAISREDQVRDGRREVPGESSVSTGALRFWVARAAVCAWANDWAAATAAGDAAAQTRAVKTLAQAPSWPAVADVDPEQTIRRRWLESTDAETGRDTSSWVSDNTPAGYFPLVRQAAVTHDRVALGAALARWGACDPALMPDFPLALPRD